MCKDHTKKRVNPEDKTAPGSTGTGAATQGAGRAHGRQGFACPKLKRTKSFNVQRLLREVTHSEPANVTLSIETHSGI